MSYVEFIKNINQYVGRVVEFTIKMKAIGKTTKTQRFVWDNKEFGYPSKDSLIEVLNVKMVK